LNSNHQYHDGGSALWTDENNVINNVSTVGSRFQFKHPDHTITDQIHLKKAAVFCHGSCPGITISPIYYNNSGTPTLQGATNNKLHDGKGVCIAATVVELAQGQQWSGVAADVVKNAGRRTDSLPPLVAPALSPPVNETSAKTVDTTACIRFAARTCDDTKLSQRWVLVSIDRLRTQELTQDPYVASFCHCLAL
jgi:hypothetical protein